MGPGDKRRGDGFAFGRRTRNTKVRERPFIAAYIMTNKFYGTLYVGMTSNLYQRVHEHREGLLPGFTREHGLKRLVWYEAFERVTSAIRRENTLKGYKRDWKINLIERMNPRWEDLYPGLVDDPNETRY